VTSVHDAITRVVRDEWPRLMAVLHRDLGDLQAAEDAAQEAAEIALQRWLDDGIPDRPGAWITTVARRRAVDRIRRERTGRDKSDLLARLEATKASRDRPDEIYTATAIGDEQLRLFFGCCHPALSVEAQVALTLRSLGGLTTAEIGRAMLTTETAVAQRIVRAKRKIAGATIPFRIPDDHELLDRIRVVHHVLYLIFNEGAYASSGQHVHRLDLAAEAIRLARVLSTLMADDAETQGLLALFLLVDSRRDARQHVDGSIVLLDAQDRTAWNHAAISEATTTIERALRLGRPGPYQIEASINAVHAEAPSSEATDWPEIVALYRALHAHRRTAVVELNWAVAVAMAAGPEAGLARLNQPRLAEALDQYHYFHSARAELHRKVDGSEHRDKAQRAYRRALDLVSNEAERAWLAQRLESLGDNA